MGAGNDLPLGVDFPAGGPLLGSSEAGSGSAPGQGGSQGLRSLLSEPFSGLPSGGQEEGQR